MSTTENNDIITSAKSFSDALTMDLTDEEIAAAFRTITQIRDKHSEIWRRKYPFDSDTTIHKLLDEFSDEVKTKLADVGILASVDTTPLLGGQPPEIDIIGKIGSATAEFDHEKKGWEVKKAHARGEAFYGEKESHHGSYKSRDRGNTA